HKNKQKDKEDAKVVIRIDGNEWDVEEYFEDLGENIEYAVEQFVDGNDGVVININEEELNINFDGLGEFVSVMAENFAESIESAVEHMEVEVYDIDPDRIDDSDIHFDIGGRNGLETLLEEIEEFHGSPVEHIDRLLMKIREGYVEVEMDVLLENGSRIKGLRREIEND
ncbi:hypothetical protein, partial [Xanthovirga aplysinae]|uniref:hypothetical protein n=1 Tax=Xanthovirga aplysinae TaxID=2529853 RepID=UPI0016570621